MTEFLSFASAHPVTAVFLLGLVLQAGGSVLMFLVNRPLRHWNIHKHGWPPEHCDADGDFLPK